MSSLSAQVAETQKKYKKLCEDEYWKVHKKGDQYIVLVHGREFPLTHPFQICAKLYRTETNPAIKFNYLKKMHDIAWPHYTRTWTYWDEEFFMAHCEGWPVITMAGGASTGKSFRAAKLVDLFFLAYPSKRVVTVASTTLDSLNRRIYGYCTQFLAELAVPLKYTLLRGKPPKVLYDQQDSIHGIFAVSAKEGDDERAISTWIGSRGEAGTLLVLDEGTDMPMAVLGALPNLSAGGGGFQCVAIGNSNSKFDLHGSLSTPKAGWSRIDPLKDTKWETVSGGICLFYSCYNSPAILETDPAKKKLLGHFYITQEQLDKKISDYGTDSESFWRFVLGFWKSSSTENVVISKEVLAEHKVAELAEWSGLYPLKIVAGVDPAFSTGGDKPVLRLAVLGVNTKGEVVLDYRKNELLFEMSIVAVGAVPAERQMAVQIKAILNKYGVSLRDCAFDASGSGRALSEVVKLEMGVNDSPIKILSVRHSENGKAVNSFDVVIRTSYDLWYSFRPYVLRNQIKGLDIETMQQLSSRLIVTSKDATKKSKLEPKIDYKKRMGAINANLAHSPDRADAAALALQIAILNYNFTPGQKVELPKLNLMDEKYDIYRRQRQEQLKNKEGEVEVKKVNPPTARFNRSMEALVSSGGGSSLFIRRN